MEWNQAVSLYLKHDYIHMPILQGHHRFLPFFHGKKFQFRVLPLASHPRLGLHKLYRVIVIFCRRLATSLITHLDDTLLLAQSKDQQQKGPPLGLPQHLGFLDNWEKFGFASTKEMDFIGLHWSSGLMSASLPQVKALKLQGGGCQASLVRPPPPNCRAIRGSWARPTL